jgi:hypothetical protein
VLFDESLDCLAIYNEPDRLIYDPPPSKHAHLLAQYAQRAETWEALLKERSTVGQSVAATGKGDNAVFRNAIATEMPPMPPV